MSLAEFLEVEVNRLNPSGLFSSTNLVVWLGTDPSPLARDDKFFKNSDACRPSHDRTLFFLAGLCESREGETPHYGLDVSCRFVHLAWRA